ncbi:ABC transporter substrate-binding protein [Chloroflexota bacterium]
MKNKIIWLVLSCLMALSLVLASCGPAVPEEEEEVAPEKEEMVKEGTWWDRMETPKYGGTHINRSNSDPGVWDPFNSRFAGFFLMHLEGIGMPGFMVVDPKIFNFPTRFTPYSYQTGQLVESWEVENWQTMTCKVREGVYWHDIPPVNGRELTAYDIEYAWHRQFGLGSGYTEPSPWFSVTQFRLLDEVTATGKYEIVFHLSEPSFMAIQQLFENCTYNHIAAKEAIELWGDVNTWDRQIGTGPFILTDYVSGSSVAWVRNDNYWGYDEHYPENRLPYVDEVKTLIIPDSATALAALRSGKIDEMDTIGWEQAESLMKTNPELMVERSPGVEGLTLYTRVTVKPYSDINVRKALQMALDLETIAESYYGGIPDGKPCTVMTPVGYSTPYDEWPEEVKAGYTYNPDGAKALLAEAGYPDGFKATISAAANNDLQLLQVLKAYWADINVDVEIEVKEPAAWSSYVYAGKSDFSVARWGQPWQSLPVGHFQHFMESNPDFFCSGISDPVYDKLFKAAEQALGPELVKEAWRACGDHITKNHWQITTQPTFRYYFTQPYIKNVARTEDRTRGPRVARLWVDQDLKTSMGR